MIPDTSASLILRIRDPQDRDAWEQFAHVYRPVIFRAARSKGLQDADADEISQQVLTSISRALQNRPHDSERAKFRTWLYRVTHNAMLNFIQRRKSDQGMGGTGNWEQLAAVPLKEDVFSQYEEDYQQSVFRWAAEQIRPEFQAATWQAFWMTMIDGKECQEVADQLGKELGSIYAARSRVVKRLKEKVQEFDDSCQID